MQGFKLSVQDRNITLINFENEVDIPGLLNCEKIICSNCYLGNYKYTVYSNPERKEPITLVASNFSMMGDLIIVPQLGKVHDFDYSAIMAATTWIATRDELNPIIHGVWSEN